MANVVKPDDLTICRVEKRHPKAAKVELAVCNPACVALGLHENILRT